MTTEHRHHFLLAINNVTPVQRTALTSMIQSNADDGWFNYTPDAWLLCTKTKPEEYRDRILAILSNSPAYFLLLRIHDARVAGGLLPAEAWEWLRHHNML